MKQLIKLALAITMAILAPVAYPEGHFTPVKTSLPGVTSAPCRADESGYVSGTSCDFYVMAEAVKRRATGRKLNYSIQEAHAIVRTTFAVAHNYRLDPYLLMAVLSIESFFDPNAVSHAGALGIAQVIPYWHPEKGIDESNAFDTAHSINVGARILREYLDREKGNMRRALLRYNGSLLHEDKSYPVTVFAERERLLKFRATRIKQITQPMT